MKKYITTLIVFLTINFGGLAIGQVWTGDGVTSNWYTSLNQAPWTPPGWVFGLAWTTIAITFSIYKYIQIIIKFFKFQAFRIMILKFKF